MRFYYQSNVQGKRIVSARDISLTRASYIVRYYCEVRHNCQDRVQAGQRRQHGHVPA